MGVGVTGAHLAYMAFRRGAVYRSTLTIGRQKLFMWEHQRPFFRAQNPRLDDAQISAILEQEYAESLFKALGAQIVDSLDASDYEGATIIEDLNWPIRGDLKRAYSVVVDFGTLEHIFNVPVALKNCIDMVEVEGWYIYCGPCNNLMGHGFYQFSPELFFNFLSHNGFRGIEVFICLYEDPIFFKAMDPRLFGGRIELANDEAAQICVLAKKAAHLEQIVYPIQSDYQKSLWRHEIPSRGMSQTSDHPVDPALSETISATKKMGLNLLRIPKSTAPQLLNGFENTLQYKYINPFEEVVSPALVNLALNKPALQSSTSVWSSRPSPENDAKGGNNGEITRPYGFHTDCEGNPWWQVDLQDQFLIRRVLLYNREGCEERLKYFSILKSLDGKRWQVIFSKQDNSVFGHDDALPYVAEISGDHLARYVKIRLNGVDFLHFSECQVFGELASADVRQQMIEDPVASAEQERLELPPGRNGKLIEIDDFTVFADFETYAPEIIATLESGWYEEGERRLAREILEPGDRIIEAGTALGLVTMTAASLVGATNVLTFEANPEIKADAQCNFRRNGLDEIKSRWGVLKNRRSIGAKDEMIDFYIAKQFLASRLDASENDEGISKKVEVPVFCLEDEIEAHRANVLICDIEGGEVDLLTESDLTGISKIIVETHWWAGDSETAEMMRKLISAGFSIDQDLSCPQLRVLRR